MSRLKLRFSQKAAVRERQTAIAAVLLVALMVSSSNAAAQLTRERADPGGPVDFVFSAPTLISTSTVTTLPQGSLDFTIIHSFGLVSGGVEELFGLDGAANIRFGLDYSIHDRISVGLGRARFDKLYDGRIKANVLRQTRDGRMPIELAVQGGMAVTTARTAFDVELDPVDRLSYMASVMIARKFSERLSVQVAPLFGHENAVFITESPDGTVSTVENDHLAIVGIARLALRQWLAVVAEVVPVLGSRSNGTRDVASIGVELDTGGHVFQLFVTSTQWFTPQHMLSRSHDDFLAGDFRMGFNVHRVFAP